MQKRNSYRKHKVRIEGSYIPVKDWMRENSRKFSHISGVPTSEQIGKILVNEGYSRGESPGLVLYKK